MTIKITTDQKEIELLLTKEQRKKLAFQLLNDLNIKLDLQDKSKDKELKENEYKRSAKSTKGAEIK